MKLDFDKMYIELFGNAGVGKCITIPSLPFYWEMLGDLEEVGYTITDEIMSLCKQIEQELNKQDLETAE
jgi:hypothetical protein